MPQREYHFMRLLVWQNAMELAHHIYAMTSRFPDVELNGMSAQLRRAAMAIPTRIAEGHGQLDPSGLLLSLGAARGSLYEVVTLVHLAKQLKFGEAADADRVEHQAQQVIGRLDGLIAAMQSASSKRTPPESRLPAARFDPSAT